MLLSTGCSSNDGYVETSIDVWNCRSGKPVLVSNDDVLAPKFVDLKFPNTNKHEIKY